MTDDFAKAAMTIARSIEACLISPNVLDSNLESANIVDVLSAVAKSNTSLAIALNEATEAANGLSHAIDQFRVAGGE